MNKGSINYTYKEFHVDNFRKEICSFFRLNESLFSKFENYAMQYISGVVNDEYVLRDEMKSNRKRKEKDSRIMTETTDEITYVIFDGIIVNMDKFNIVKIDFNISESRKGNVLCRMILFPEKVDSVIMEFYNYCPANTLRIIVALIKYKILMLHLNRVKEDKKLFSDGYKK